MTIHFLNKVTKNWVLTTGVGDYVEDPPYWMASLGSNNHRTPTTTQVFEFTENNKIRNWDSVVRSWQCMQIISEHSNFVGSAPCIDSNLIQEWRWIPQGANNGGLIQHLQTGKYLSVTLDVRKGKFIVQFSDTYPPMDSEIWYMQSCSRPRSKLIMKNNYTCTHESYSDGSFHIRCLPQSQ